MTNVNLFPLNFSIQAKEVNFQGGWVLAMAILFIFFYNQVKEAKPNWLN